MLMAYRESEDISSLPAPVPRVMAISIASTRAVISPVLFVLFLAPIHPGARGSVSTCHARTWCMNPFPFFVSACIVRWSRGKLSGSIVFCRECGTFRCGLIRKVTSPAPAGGGGWFSSGSVHDPSTYVRHSYLPSWSPSPPWLLLPGPCGATGGSCASGGPMCWCICRAARRSLWAWSVLRDVAFLPGTSSILLIVSARGAIGWLRATGAACASGGSSVDGRLWGLGLALVIVFLAVLRSLVAVLCDVSPRASFRWPSPPTSSNVPACASGGAGACASGGSSGASVLCAVSSAEGGSSGGVGAKGVRCSCNTSADGEPLPFVTHRAAFQYSHSSCSFGVLMVHALVSRYCSCFFTSINIFDGERARSRPIVVSRVALRDRWMVHSVAVRSILHSASEAACDCSPLSPTNRSRVSLGFRFWCVAVFHRSTTLRQSASTSEHSAYACSRVSSEQFSHLLQVCLAPVL